MLIKQFESNTIIKQQKQEHNMNLLTDPLDNALTTSQIQTGWDKSIELYPNRCFGCIDNLNRLSVDIRVSTPTRIRTGGPEPLQTVPRWPSNLSSPANCMITLVDYHNSMIIVP